MVLTDGGGCRNDTISKPLKSERHSENSSCRTVLAGGKETKECQEDLKDYSFAAGYSGPCSSHLLMRQECKTVSRLKDILKSEGAVLWVTAIPVGHMEL
jgi:hypothetical protein